MLKKQTIYRLFILFIGLIIAHLGVTLFLLADLGSDPFNVLIQGLFRSLEGLSISWLTHGYTHVASCFLIVIILLFVDKSYVKIGTFVCMLFGGPIIDIWTKLLDPVFNSESPFALRLVGLALGCIILAYGMTIVIKSEAGTGPNDLVAVVISDKTKKPFSILRIIVDICFVGIGFLLGGVVGIGTIICAFLVGPVAGIFLPINEKLIKKLIKD